MMSADPRQHHQHQYQPQPGLGPVHALAQAYHRTHGRAHSEQLPVHYQAGQHGLLVGPAEGSPSHRRNDHLGHGPSGSLSADDLAVRLARLDTAPSSQPIPQPTSPLKPLPALPPARTPSQHRHQQQNQQPYRPHLPASASSSTALGVIAERPPSAGQAHGAPLSGSSSSVPALAFPEPPHQGYSFPYAPSAQAHTQGHESAAAWPRPLPRPPVRIDFPQPREHMRPPTHLTPPHLPALASSQTRGQTTQPMTPHRRPVSAEPTVSTPPHGQEGRPNPMLAPAETAVRPHSADEASSMVLHRPVGRPGLSSAGTDLSTNISQPIKTSSTSPHRVGAITPSPSGSGNLGLRHALPPPLPGQCWGIKRDGTRCTRKAGAPNGGAGKGAKSRATTPNGSPSATTRTGVQRIQGLSATPSPSSSTTSKALSRVRTGATRTKPIVVSDSSDGDDDDDDWLVQDSSDEELAALPAAGAGDKSLAGRGRLLAVPTPERKGHRRSRSAESSVVAIPSNSHLADRGPGATQRRADRLHLDAGTTLLSDEEGEDEDSGTSEEAQPVYCFQHASEINKSPGFYLPSTSSSCPSKRDGFVSFAEYMFGPDGRPLDASTQASLRAVMAAPLSVADSPACGGMGARGYMYIYELRSLSTATEVCLKVGRTRNVFRRMGEWRGRCRRRGAGLVLVGFEPSPAGDGAVPAQGLLPGAAEVWCEGIHGSHKWERLTHLELLDIGRRLDEGACEDCGARHREIFLFPRSKKIGQGHGHDGGNGEDDAIARVVGVVRKWEGFVRRVVEVAPTPTRHRDG